MVLRLPPLDRLLDTPHQIMNYEPKQSPNYLEQTYNNSVTQTDFFMKRAILQDQSEPSDSKELFKRFTFIIFVDKHLGLGSGKEYLNLETQQICLVLDDQSQRYSSHDKKVKYDVHVYFYDLSDPKRMEMGMRNLKSMTDVKNRKLRIIVCGNESTVGTVVGMAEKGEVSIENIPIGIVPSGQYNDLSSVLGWGEVESEELVGTDLRFLKQHVKKWTNAVIEKIDIWRVEIEADDGGEIEAVDRVKQRKIVMSERVHRQLMISHFNIGVHARIGLGFDLNKGESNVGNKFIHAFQSFKKMMCMSTAKVDKMVSLVEIKVDKEKGNKEVYRTLFTSKQQGNEGNGMKHLDSSSSLACLNIDRYQGIQSVWRHSTSKEDDNTQSSIDTFQTQSYHDSKLQLVTFSSTLGSSSTKLCQTDGTFQIKMQRHQPAYIQIDNTPYKIISPKQVRVSKHGRLQVLINKQSLITH